MHLKSSINLIKRGQNPPKDLEKKEKFVVNFARTEKYFKSAIPQCQRALNDFFQEKEKNAI